MQVLWSAKSFRWSIRNFSDICGIRVGDAVNESNNNELPQTSQEYNCLLDIDFLQSPVIDVGSEGHQSQWFFRLTKSADDENDIDFYMELAHIGFEYESQEVPEESECFFKYRIDIIGSDGQIFKRKDTDKIIYLKSGRSWCENCLIRVDHLRDHADEVLLNDTLNLQIDLFVLNDLHHSRVDGLAAVTQPDAVKPTKKRKCSSSCDWEEILSSCQFKLSKQVLNNLWKTRLNNDVTIECADLQLKAHKSVLSSCSPVFSAAFTHDTSENLENRIVISDISPTTLETVIRFIYCDTNLEEPQWRNVDDLTEILNAAEKYQITTLKSLCFSKLCDELTLNNAAQVTSLVYLFNPEESVRHFVHQYVLSNISILKEMDSFKRKLSEIPAAFTPLLLLISD